jgi:hypothetical protein
VVTSELLAKYTNKTDGCWLWTGRFNNMGYGKICSGDGEQYAHRVSWALANGSVPAGLFVCHRCDNPACINPDHLFLGTQKDNMQDCKDKGRFNSPKRMASVRKGTSINTNKLTEDDVRDVRKKIAEGWSLSSIGVMFGVSVSAIWTIRHGRSWVWLK